MESLVLEEIDGEFIYSRNGCMNRFKLQGELAKLYELNKFPLMKINPKDDPVARSDLAVDDGIEKRVLIFTSGMNAISAVMNLCAVPNPQFTKPVFLLASELFSVTPKIADFQKRYNSNLSCELIDVRDSNALKTRFEKKDIVLFFIESCSNPSGQIMDLELIKELKVISPHTIVCVDNTWCTAYSVNPFEYGADLVVESMTKYISAGTCIGGMVAGRPDLMSKIFDYSKHYGLFVGSDHCRLFLNGISTLKDRVETTSKLTIKVAEQLESNTKIIRILYPGLISHPDNEKFKKYLKLNPGVIWFNIRNTAVLKRNDVIKILSSGKLPFKTSFGGSESRIDQFPKVNKTDIWIRLAIGYDANVEDTISGLIEVLNKF